MQVMEKIVSLKNVSKTFPVGKSLLGKPTKFVHAVNNVSFDVFEGETFSIVGESGCGKSTTGRLINHLLTPDSGEIWFMGKEISRISQDAMRPLRKDMQMIFQDPAGSLDPRMRVAELIEEPLLIHTDMSAGERMKVVNELLGIVGLSAKHAKRYPHEFSGGQKQRIGIARALTVNPKLVIADEPISALDVSIQAQVVNLMKTLQKELGAENATCSFCTSHAVQGRIMLEEIVDTMMRSTSSGLTSPSSRAFFAASQAMDTVVSSLMICLVATPVRSLIHSSLVSTIVAISLLSIT